MLLNKKYIIGTHVMFYEVEMISEFVNSVYKAVNQVDNKDNITVDFLFNFSQYFEKIDTKQITIEDIKKKFINSNLPIDIKQYFSSKDIGKIVSFMIKDKKNNSENIKIENKSI